MSEEKEAKPGSGEKKPRAEIRRVNIGAHVVAQIVLASLLFLLVNFLSYRHYSLRDLTDDQRYTIDGATADYLRFHSEQRDHVGRPPTDQSRSLRSTG
jgi:hypothetical protein